MRDDLSRRGEFAAKVRWRPQSHVGLYLIDLRVRPPIECCWLAHASRLDRKIDQVVVDPDRREYVSILSHKREQQGIDDHVAHDVSDAGRSLGSGFALAVVLPCRLPHENE